MALALGQATVRPEEGERDHRKEELGVFCEGLDTVCSIMLSMTRINVTVDRVRRKSLSGRRLSQVNLQDLPADFSLLPPDAEISTAFEQKPEAGLRGSPSIISLDNKALRGWKKIRPSGRLPKVAVSRGMGGGGCEGEDALTKFESSSTARAFEVS
ncbi:hypothetical protein JMJ76_0010475 [Colletotrichum scovillei]|nr:hypothetical protein JMJ76_0010475 [Colletotrichum scovillei]